jgi:tight adherence protein B
VRVFAVGLRSRAFDAKPLQALARDTGGLYVPARSAGKLEGIYRQLGSVLANQYLLRYHSLVGSSQRSTTVNVRVRVDGFAGDARTGYAAPASSASARVFRQPLGIRLWTARTTQVLVILVSAVLLAFAVIVVLRPRKTRLPQRMAQFVSVGTPEETQGSITGRMLLEAERSLDGAPWWERLKENLELAEMDVPPSHVVAGTIVATIFSMWLLSLLTPLAVLLALFVPLGVRAFIALKVGRVRKAFEDQLPDNLLVLASAMKAGHSFIAALSVVADDALEPSRSEFRRVVADEQLGVPAEEALQVVVRRMASRDVEQVALVAAVQRQSGGNSAEVLGRVAETVRERAELRRLVKTLTAPGRVSGWIVTSLPLALLSVITVINRPYMAQMYTDPMGQVLLVVGAFMLIFGAIVIQRIVNIKV